MKFNIRQYRAFQNIMKPTKIEDTAKTELLAEILTEFVLPRYMSDNWEFAGYENGEAVFFNTATGEYATASELWSTCKFVEDCAANGGTLPEADEDYTPEDWYADDEDIII